MCLRAVQALHTPTPASCRKSASRQTTGTSLTSLLTNTHAAVLHRQIIFSPCQERRVALAAGEAVPQDLLGVLLTAADDRGDHMTDEELWEDVHDVMGAGGVVSLVLLPEKLQKLCNVALDVIWAPLLLQ